MGVNKTYCLSWTEFHQDTRQLVAEVLRHNPDNQWRGIVAIARGGLVPAAILARELGIRRIEALCIASYEHDRQGKPEVLNTIDSDGTGILLVDDLVDTGVTAGVARELLPRAHFVSVYAKPAGRELADQYVREFPQDTWIHFPWDVQLQYSEPMASR